MIVLPLPFQVDLHTHERSSSFSFVIAIHGSIILSLLRTCSIIVSISHGYERGLSLDFHSLGNLTVGWRRMALCCFGLQGCLTIMCFSILVLVTSVPDDVTFTPPFLDGLPLTARYTLVFGIEVFVLDF